MFRVRMTAFRSGLTVAHNTKIDEIKVIQNHYEAFNLKTSHL